MQPSSKVGPAMAGPCNRTVSAGPAIEGRTVRDMLRESALTGKNSFGGFVIFVALLSEN